MLILEIISDLAWGLNSLLLIWVFFCITNNFHFHYTCLLQKISSSISIQLNDFKMPSGGMLIHLGFSPAVDFDIDHLELCILARQLLCEIRLFVQKLKVPKPEPEKKGVINSKFIHSSEMLLVEFYNGNYKQ